MWLCAGNRFQVRQVRSWKTMHLGRLARVRVWMRQDSVQLGQLPENSIISWLPDYNMHFSLQSLAVEKIFWGIVLLEGRPLPFVTRASQCVTCSRVHSRRKY